MTVKAVKPAVYSTLDDAMSLLGIGSLREATHTERMEVIALARHLAAHTGELAISIAIEMLAETIAQNVGGIDVAPMGEAMKGIACEIGHAVGGGLYAIAEAMNRDSDDE